jgi:hypothetical protein
MADACRRPRGTVENRRWLKRDLPAFSRLFSAAVPTDAMVHFTFCVNPTEWPGAPCGERKMRGACARLCPPVSEMELWPARPPPWPMRKEPWPGRHSPRARLMDCPNGKFTAAFGRPPRLHAPRIAPEWRKCASAKCLTRWGTKPTPTPGASVLFPQRERINASCRSDSR